MAPNTIDFNFVFANSDFFRNPTLYVTQIVVGLAYVLALVWARRKDRRDIEKVLQQYFSSSSISGGDSDGNICCLLVAYRPSNMLVYLRDRSALTTLRDATMR